MSNAEAMFVAGESITCIYKGSAYAAKVLSIVPNNEGKSCYHIHFKGWNTRYDEKIPIGQESERMFKGSYEDYKAKHNDPAPQASKTTKKKTDRTDSREDTPSSKIAKTPKKPAIPPVMTVSDMKIELPKPLKKILIDDYDLINRNFITKVPATFTVDRIVTDYIKTVPTSNETLKAFDDLLIEYDEADTKTSNVTLICTVRGLVDYFNVTLGYQLLYKFERTQYNDLVQKYAADKGLKPGSIATLPEHGFRSSAEYGIIHLLRMIAKLQDLFKLTPWNDHLIRRISMGIHDFIVFLNKNHGQYYAGASDYESSSPEYYRRAHTSEDDQPGPSA